MSEIRLLDHWSAPEGAGSPVACLATTFTFDADFFTQDCLSRFLGLSTLTGEGDAISSLAATLQEEDKLSEAQVTVLVDRSTSAEKRNLRWDLLPVAAPGGLLHAKVALLLWRHHARIVVGSANLTPAGYRHQVEIATAFDLAPGCQVPRPVLDDFRVELERLVALAPGPAASGPKKRALDTLRLLAGRIAELDLPPGDTGQVHLALAAARPGVNPLDQLTRVWRGPQPLHATVVSPFWGDDSSNGAIAAISSLRTGRPVNRRQLRLLAAVDPHTGIVQAPPRLAGHTDARLFAYEPTGTEPRRLHAKLILLESDSWVAAMVGSSNATAAGLGLNAGFGHHELNVWIGCPADSTEAKRLRVLARRGQPLHPDDHVWDVVPDEDEATTLPLPLGFESCLVEPGTPNRVHLGVVATKLPAEWTVRDPAGHKLLDAAGWRDDGATNTVTVDLPSDELPAYLVVGWSDDEAWHQATWTANVTDRGTLPPPAELSQLPVHLLLAALASTRPLTDAIEAEVRRQQRAATRDADLDPLRRFDDSGLLLQRVRHHSLALWRLRQRLSQPASSIDAIRWRLHGAFGPAALAQALHTAASAEQALPGESQFLIAELALTIRAVDWAKVGAALDHTLVDNLVTEVLTLLHEHHQRLPAAPDPALDAYVADALKEATGR